MYMTDAIDKRLPYRVGYPTLLPLPVKSEYVEPVYEFRPVYESISEILFQLGIPVFNMGLRFRYHKGNRAQVNTPTFLIVSSYDPQDKDSQAAWLEAVKRIHAYFLRSNISCIIEIIDKEVAWGFPTPRPIMSTEDKILKATAKIMPQMVTEIMMRAWVTVDVLHWHSPSGGDYHPTIIISARDASDPSWWSTTLPSIRKIIDDAESDLDVILLFLSELSILSASEEASEESSYQEPDPCVLEYFYDDPNPMGTSCGPLNSPRSGTLGGKIVLEKDGNRLVLGLTNCHVLLHDLIMSKNHVGPFLPGQLLEDVVVVSPSDRDHETAIERFQERANTAEAKLQSQRQFYGESTLSSDEQRRLEMLDHRAKSTRVYLNTGRNVSREVGTVFAASGYTTCNGASSHSADSSDTNELGKSPLDSNWALDWCLIRWKDLKCVESHVDETATVPTWMHVDPHENYQVKKQGRSTGLTVGCVGAVQSQHNPSSVAPEFVAKASTIARDKIKGIYEDKPVTMHSIVSTSSQHDGHFMLPGDSGSLVQLDEKESARTLGLCSASNDSSKASYMIPMQLIVSSINDVTSGKVVEPVEE